MSKPKSKDELANELRQQQVKNFVEDYDKLTHELAVKHGYQLVPVLQYTPGGIKAVFDVTKVTHTLDAKADTPADTNDSVSA
jgi:hypothetical protein